MGHATATLSDPPCAVYAAYNKAGHPIYIGVAEKPKRRRAQHEANQPWISEVDHWGEITWCKDRAAALRLEAHLIRRHRPRWNQDGNPDEHLVRQRLQALARPRRHWTLRLIGALFRTLWTVLTIALSLAYAILTTALAPPPRRPHQRSRRRPYRHRQRSQRTTKRW